MERLQALRLFVEVAATGSFSRAAERLAIPRATATNAIQALERQLGVRLFNRTTRQVALTREGEQYLERCRRLLADVDDLDTLFSQSGVRPSGIVRIDVPERLATQTLIPALPGFFEQFPDIHLRVGTSGRYVDLIGEGVDCVIRVGQLADSNLVARPVGVLHQVNCATPGYLRRFGIPSHPEQLAGHVAVGYFSARLGRDLDWEWQEDGRPHSVRLPCQVSVASSEAYLACGLASLGLLQVPRVGVAAYLAAGDLVEVLPDWRPAPLPVAILHAGGRALAPRVRAFVDWAAAMLAERHDVQKAR